MSTFHLSRTTLPELIADVEQLTAAAARYQAAGDEAAAVLASTDAMGVMQEVRARFFPRMTTFQALVATSGR